MLASYSIHETIDAICGPCYDARLTVYSNDDRYFIPLLLPETPSEKLCDLCGRESYKTLTLQTLVLDE
jgi:hypothetical protein